MQSRGLKNHSVELLQGAHSISKIYTETCGHTVPHIQMSITVNLSIPIQTSNSPKHMKSEFNPNDSLAELYKTLPNIISNMICPHNVI